MLSSYADTQKSPKKQFFVETLLQKQEKIITVFSDLMYGQDFVCGFIFGAALSLCLERYYVRSSNLRSSWRCASPVRKHWKAGMCSTCDHILFRDGYAVGYNYFYRSPCWVSYIACRSSIGAKVPTEGTGFSTDSDIPEKYRAKPRDYLHTGFDRGHLAPLATINFSLRSSEQTMFVTNICLQHPHLNRHGWKVLENSIRRWVALRGKHAVATGPIWEPTKNLKLNGIGVPKSFFLAVYSYATGETIGFIMPNKATVSKDVWNYVYSINEVEQLANIEIFRQLPFRHRPIRYRRQSVSLEFWKSI